MKRRTFIKGVGGSSAALVSTGAIPGKEKIFTLTFWSNPEKYLDPEAASEVESLAEWRDFVFEHESDPLFGLWDTSKSVEEFLENPDGDCTDFSRLAASWFVANDEPAYLLVIWKGGMDFHMVAHNGEESHDMFRREPVENYYERAIFHAEKRIA